MCPSFRATREEKHSTRGRTRLLFEMLRGDSILDGWRDEGVKEALDLCLSCKGCKGDCPVTVDLATYKAEFLSHYWDGRMRPRSAYALGLIDVWARAASVAPGLVNLCTQTPGINSVAKVIAGMPQQRRIPAFAPTTFQQWFRRRVARRPAGHRQVVLWPDTFTNHFHPDIAQAAVEVLENAGFGVRVPTRAVCCGRPLYDFGMLERARQYLQNTIALLDQLGDDLPIVVLEPSCASVFRDELINLLGDDQKARQLSQRTFLLGDFLKKFAPDFSPPKLDPPRKALVHGHCHQKALMDQDSEIEWLKRMGIEAEVLDSGCCGMAGSFGFENEKYEVSVKCGEHVLLPKVRDAGSQDLIVANGFSCQEQIAQLTDRHALHLAQIFQMALHPETRNGQCPESSYVQKRQCAVNASMLRAGMGIAGTAATLGFTMWALNRRLR